MVFRWTSARAEIEVNVMIHLKKTNSVILVANYLLTGEIVLFIIDGIDSWLNIS